MTGIAGPIVDLARHADTLAEMARRASMGQTFVPLKMFARTLEHERSALERVFEDAVAHPAAFTGAPDVWLGAQQLGRAVSTLDAAANAARGAWETRVPTGVRSLLPGPSTVVDEHPEYAAAHAERIHAAVDLVREAHRNLSGGVARDLPDYEPGPMVDRASLAFDDAVVDEPVHRVAQWFGRAGLRAGVRELAGVHVLGAGNVPRGGAIIAPDHVTTLDTPRMMAALDRPFRPVANSAGQYAHPVFGPMARMVGSIPITYGQTGAGFARIRSVLRDGQLVLMSPSGKQMFSRMPAPHGRGVPQIAIETGVPVVPVGQAGAGLRQFTGRRGWPGATVSIGEPLQPPTHMSDFNLRVFAERLARAQGAERDRAHADQLARGVEFVSEPLRGSVHPNRSRSALPAG